MQYRAGMVGGTLQIEHRDTGGTRVKCTVLIGEGLTTSIMANKLFLSQNTIDTHRENIKRKLAVVNSAFGLPDARVCWLHAAVLVFGLLWPADDCVAERSFRSPAEMQSYRAS